MPIVSYRTDTIWHYTVHFFGAHFTPNWVVKIGKTLLVKCFPSPPLSLKGSTVMMGGNGPWIVHCQCLPTAINRAVMKMATWTWTIYDKKWNLSRVLKVSFEFAKYDNRRAYFLRQTNYKCLFCLWMKEHLVKRLLLFMYKICIFGIFWNLCRLLMQS